MEAPGGKQSTRQVVGRTQQPGVYVTFLTWVRLILAVVCNFGLESELLVRELQEDCLHS